MIRKLLRADCFLWCYPRTLAEFFSCLQNLKALPILSLFIIIVACFGDYYVVADHCEVSCLKHTYTSIEELDKLHSMGCCMFSVVEKR